MGLGLRRETYGEQGNQVRSWFLQDYRRNSCQCCRQQGVCYAVNISLVGEGTQRGPQINDSTMDTIKVTIDPENNVISVYNNGRGIPIEIHQKEKIYVPELIFGHLLSSSNYDDDEKKLTGGRNGYGAKLANIYSTEFTVETADKERAQKYVQTWTENMGKCGKAKITKNGKKEEYTRVTFKPDLKRFGMDSIVVTHAMIQLAVLEFSMHTTRSNIHRWVRYVAILGRLITE